MKKSVYNGLLVLITVFVMAGVFETLCRILFKEGMNYHVEMWRYAVELKRISKEPKIGHEHIPGTHARLMGVDISINSDGLRNDEVEFLKPPGVTRILMLGDSITFGWGVAFEETMPKVIERNLMDHGLGPVEVINSGVGNYNTVMEVNYFFNQGKAYDPDVIILNYFINDAEPNPTYKAVSWFARHSYSYAVIGGAWDGLKRRIFDGADWQTYYGLLYAEGSPGWLAAKQSIAALAEYCRANNIRLVIANIPELRKLKKYPFEDITAKVREISEFHQVEFVDLLAALQEYPPETLWVTRPDPHPNGWAQDLMGRSLSNHLLRTSGHNESGE